MIARIRPENVEPHGRIVADRDRDACALAGASAAARASARQAIGYAGPVESDAGVLPIKLAFVDVEDGPVEISAERSDGIRYEGLWLLLRTRGAPRALVKGSFDRQPTALIDGAQVLAELGVTDVATEPHALPDAPPISVVVATTFSRDSQLRACIGAIAALDYPRFEVLLIDNSRGENSAPRWLAGFPSVRVLREEAAGVSAARNCGLYAADGSIVAFTDDDTRVDPGWLQAIARRFALRADEAVVTGLSLPRELDTAAQLAIERYYRPERVELLQPLSRRLATLPARRRLFRPAEVEARNDAGELVSRFSLYEAGRFGIGNNMALRAEPARSIGGFDVRLGPGTPTLAGEDIELFARLAWAGHSIGFEPAALIEHAHRGDDDSLRRQIEGYGMGFTAAALALTFDDPRHVAAMAATAPRAIRLLGRNFARKLHSDRSASTGRESSNVAALARLELRGMIRGPLAYLRSRHRVRAGRSQ